MSIQFTGPVVPPDGTVTAPKINSGAATVGFVLTADGMGGADFDELPAAGGGLLASGATIGATSQAQVFTNGVGASDLTLTPQASSVITNAAGKLSYRNDTGFDRLVLGQGVNVHAESVPIDPRNGFRNQLIATLYGSISEALAWLAAQVFQAAVSIAATLSTVLLNVNQSGTGDIATFQDAGVSVVRLPDQGGMVLVPQAGGFQVLTGLVGYDNAAAGFKRLKFQHEAHTGPVPIDPRNGFRDMQFVTTYP